MSEESLRGRHVLIVEDEYLLADDLSDALSDVGAKVVGPAGSIEQATALILSREPIDVAILDVNLRGEMVFPVADALRQRGIPFAFATGYDRWALPERFSDVPRIEKPLRSERVTALLQPLVGN